LWLARLLGSDSVRRALDQSKAFVAMSSNKEPEAFVLLAVVAITVLLFIAMALLLILPALWR